MFIRLKFMFHVNKILNIEISHEFSFCFGGFTSKGRLCFQFSNLLNLFIYLISSSFVTKVKNVREMC